jgi:CspA family cold shock protein
MNLFSQLVISLIAAAAATAAITQVPLQTPTAIASCIAIACCITPIIARLVLAARTSSPKPAREKQSRPAKTNTETKPKSKPKASAAVGDREEGEVKWFNVSKGFGFIRRDNDEEVFVHFRSIRSSDSSRRGLRDGQRVSYIVVDSDKGPQAEDVEEL